MEKRKKSSFGRAIFGFFTLLLFLFLIAAAAGYFYYSNNLQPATSGSREIEIDIPKGTGVKGIAAILESKGVIKDDMSFWIYCRLNNKDSKFQAGRYVLDSSLSVDEIINKLTSGQAKIETVKFTIPEGYELRLIADKLSEQGLVDRAVFEEALKEDIYDYDFLSEIGDRENKLEGYLFPDTYEVYKNVKSEDIINKMLSRFNQIYTEEFRSRARELNMTTDQVITLASIIEREAKVEEERKLVSAVFHNRLKINMMLQSCATVQYLLKERKDVLTYKDLEIDSPYNTYKYAGLPPGPIASPGLKSIEAALYPADVDYLYFVAKEDGSHIFSKTYQEHLNAQRKIKK
ncbi:MAG: endolytic transglycosylase MltG [Bacillota bacterium]